MRKFQISTKLMLSAKGLVKVLDQVLGEKGNTMRYYYYTAWESKEDRKASAWNTPTIQGWVLAQNIDLAEKMLSSRGFVRDSLTFYTRAERMVFNHPRKDSLWVNVYF